MKRLILASGSPRRAKILRDLGVEFEIVKTEASEVSIPHDPVRTVTANACAKLRAAAVGVAGIPPAHEGTRFCTALPAERAILAADTIVWFDNRIYGKPRDLAEAKARLSDDSAARARYALIADYFPAAFQTQRAKASYKPPVYAMRRRPAAAKGWDRLEPMKMLNTRAGGASKLPVDVRLAWDDKGVYGRVRGSYVPAADSEKDMWANDSVEVFFSPGTGKEVMYQFAFDVLDRTYVGKQRRQPILQPLDSTFKGEGFTHRTRVADGGWEAEFFIPWTVFEAKPPKAGERWNANVVVNRHSEPTESASTSFTLNNNSNLSMFGLLQFKDI